MASNKLLSEWINNLHVADIDLVELGCGCTSKSGDVLGGSLNVILYNLVLHHAAFVVIIGNHISKAEF